jgi:hypothetical protein
LSACRSLFSAILYVIVMCLKFRTLDSTQRHLDGLFHMNVFQGPNIAIPPRTLSVCARVRQTLVREFSTFSAEQCAVMSFSEVRHYGKCRADFWKILAKIASPLRTLSRCEKEFGLIIYSLIFTCLCLMCSYIYIYIYIYIYSSVFIS